MRFKKWKPLLGDKRRVKRFAIFPTRISQHTVIWWEWYWSEELYTNRVWGGEDWYSINKTLIDKPE